MDELLKKVLTVDGISGHESGIAEVMQQELKKTCDEVSVDGMGNVIGRKGKAGKKKIMIAAHMDEIGLMVKHVSEKGYLNFIKIGGIDDRILIGQRVIVKTEKGDVTGLIGLKPPHLQRDDERRKPVKYDDMFIDIGASSRDEALARVAIGDPVIFEPNAGVLHGNLCYGKAVDNRVGCYALIRIMEQVKADAEIYGVATVQEEVGLKGARTSAFGIDPDFALAVDTTIAGDTPHIKETESNLKLGGGCAVTIIEAGGRGVLVSEKVKKLIVSTAKENNIKFQLDVIEGGMTDGAIIYMNREGVQTGVISIPTRYIHSPTGVFSTEDLDAAVSLAVKVIEKVAKE